MNSSNSSEGLSMKNEFLECKNYTKTHNMIRWKSGKKVDPRLLALLESFEEIYSNRREFFKKIFHEDHDELFKKIGDVLKRKKQMKKVRSLPRSRSMNMRAIGKREIIENEELKFERFKIKTPNVIETDELRNERFKIRTPNVIVEEPDDKK